MNTWSELRETIVEILKNAHHYKSGNVDETCFLSAYQIAVLLNRDYKPLIKSTPQCPQNIGGKGEGVHTSLSQFIANSLSRDIKGAELENKVELRLFNIEGLNQFSFIDEKGRISEPSAECFSMFRYIG